METVGKVFEFMYLRDENLIEINQKEIQHCDEQLCNKIFLTNYSLLETYNRKAMYPSNLP